MSEFSKLNGYDVKDKTARAEIENIKSDITELNMNLGFKFIASIGKDYAVDILPENTTNKAFLIITTHASNTNGNGMWIYHTQTGNRFAIREASDIIWNISNNNRTISFSCASYNPVMHIYRISRT